MVTDGGTWAFGTPDTGYKLSGLIGLCGATEAHRQGGNYLFMDGHANWIARNPLRYLTQRKDGMWIAKFAYWPE